MAILISKVLAKSGASWLIAWRRECGSEMIFCAARYKILTTDEKELVTQADNQNALCLSDAISGDQNKR